MKTKYWLLVSSITMKVKKSSRPKFPKVPVSSSQNWSYMTDEILASSPRREEMTMSTTTARSTFHLSLDDIKAIHGWRRQGIRSTLTHYYVNDIVEVALRNLGPIAYDKIAAKNSYISSKEFNEAKLAKETVPPVDTEKSASL